MRIVIIGAGIAGLTSYMALKKHLPRPPAGTAPHTIHIYETYASPRAAKRRRGNAGKAEDLTNTDRASLVGGGLGIAPNGMAELRELDPELHDEILEQGYPGGVTVLKNSHGSVLGRLCSVEDGKGREYMVWVSRQVVWECMRRKVPDEVISTGKTVDVIEKVEGKGLVVKFKDGESADADLVIGADGVWSTCKKFVVGDGREDNYPPHFETLNGIGGFIPSSYLNELPKGSDGRLRDTPFVMTFGAEGFFGYGACTTPPDFELPEGPVSKNFVAPVGDWAMWWSTFEAPDSKKLKDVDKELVKRQLRDRHEKWADPVIRRIVSEVDIDLLTSTFTMPVLPSWHKENVVLVGDSAHALPSTSGQGISQALEDVHMFSSLLAHHLGQVYTDASSTQTSLAPKEAEAITRSASKYESLRKPRTSHILKLANQMGGRKKRMNIVQEYMTYALFYVFFNFFPDLFTRYILNYSVNEELKKAIPDVTAQA